MRDPWERPSAPIPVGDADADGLIRYIVPYHHGPTQKTIHVPVFRRNALIEYVCPGCGRSEKKINAYPFAACTRR